MTANPKEAAFQHDIINQMLAGGWKLGDPAKYDRKLALYTEDCLAYVKTTQPKSWEKYEKLYPGNAEQAFIDKLASQLAKADPQASDKSLRTFGTLGVLRHELRDKLRAAGIFLWSEVTQFSEVFFLKSKSNAAISNVCRPAVDRWQHRYQTARGEFEKHKKLYDHAKKLSDPTFIANAEGEMNEAKKELDALGMFKADLVSFTRYYEFMSQIVDYDSTDLERLSLFARHLAPLLREEAPQDDPIDLTSVALSHYRLSKIKQQDLTLVKEGGEGLQVSSDLGSGKARSKKEEMLSQIITRLNELFVTDQLTDKDLVNYLYTIRDKVNENQRVMHQIENNSPEQALLGDFAEAVDDAVMSSGEAHQNQMTQYLNSPELAAKFQRLVFDLLLAKGA